MMENRKQAKLKLLKKRLTSIQRQPNNDYIEQNVTPFLALFSKYFGVFWTYEENNGQREIDTIPLFVPRAFSSTHVKDDKKIKENNNTELQL